MKNFVICTGVTIAVFAAYPVLLYKVWNLVSFLAAAILAMFFSVMIIMKAIDKAVQKYGGRPDTNGRFSEPRTVVGSEVNNSDLGSVSIFRKFFMKLNTVYEAILKGLWRSVEFYHTTKHLDPTNTKAAIKNIQEQIMQHGKSPDGRLQNGTYVVVSQNVDMLMNRIFEYTYRDYVETWYATVSNDQGKLHKLVKGDFWETYKVFTSRLAKVDMINLVMNRYIKTLLRYFKELDATDPVKKNYAHFRLHPCLRDRNTETDFLRRISGYTIRLCFPYHIAANSSSRLILREILAGLVFQPLIDTICDPDYINLSILAYLQQRENAQEEKTRSYTYAATYEDFVRIISNTDNIAELQQIHRHIMTELMHATAISSLKRDDKKLAKARSMAKGELLLSRDLKRYINQCQVARQQCEKRIKALGGEGYNNEKTFGDRGNVAIASSVNLLTFEEVMASPMARSYFLKYLKKIGRGSLLKFWSEVDIVRESSPTGKELAKIISHIYQMYIAPGSPDELCIDVDKAILKGMQTCVVGNKEPDDFFKLQEHVSRILEKDHFPSFVVSDFYIRQLMPQLNEDEGRDTEIFQEESSDPNQQHHAAFGSRKNASDTALMRLQDIEDRLEYKAQALETLRPSAKPDHKLTKQLEDEISDLQKEKSQQQLHIERTETWWSRMGSWIATVDSVSLLPHDVEHPKVPVYSIIVVCSGVPIHEVTDDVSGWVVGRTLDEFRKLHQSLKQFRPWLKKRRLPSLPVLSFGNISQKFLDRSKLVLDEYLKDILKDEILSRSELVYAFLSQTPEQNKKEEVKRKGFLHRSNSNRGFTDTIPGSGARKNSLWHIGDLFLALPKDILDSILHSEDLSDSDEDETDESAVDRDSIAKPLYELISEIFEIQGLFRALRKTLIIFARVAFGGTINKQIRDTIQWLVSEPMLTYYIQIFMDSMWPDGQLKHKVTSERSEDDKIQTVLEAQVKLLQNIPEAFQNLIGHENARQGFLKIFQALQDRQLNKHLLYNIITETVEEVFPEILKTETRVQ